MDSAEDRDPVAIVCGMAQERRPFVALAADRTGWFEGGGVSASDPTLVRSSLSVSQAAAHLETAFSSGDFRLAVALLPYEGSATVHVYDSAYVRDEGVWTHRGADRGTEPSAEWRAARSPVRPHGGPLLNEPIAEMDPDDFAERIRETQRSITDGNVYVLNLTYRLRGTPGASAGSTFARLVADAPASMQALFVTPQGWVASASPERFLSITRTSEDSRIACIQPVKGTAPRGVGPLDERNARALLGSAKERAEHVMIVDLERNDLGRVCIPGTVSVDPLFDIVTTPYCHQMVSTVRGALRADASIARVLAATFPCGSVTGAPKLAAMRRIGELELSGRGAYTGALVVAMPGRLDSSVLIRTLECADGVGSWGTGCGITIDSEPAGEWQESILKTRPLGSTRS